MAELVHQTWSRVTGKPWQEAQKGGFTSGSAQANLALQKRLLGGWNPYQAPPPQQAQPQPSTPMFQSPQPSQPNPTPYEVPDLVAIQRQQAQEREAKQREQEAKWEGIFGQYRGLLGGQEKMSDAFGRLSGEAGLPELEKQAQSGKENVYNVQSLLRNLRQDVIDTTRGVGLTESQRRLQEGAKRESLNEQLSGAIDFLKPLTDRLNSAMGTVNTRLGLLSSDQATALKPLELELNSLPGRFAAEISGFNQNKSDELNVYLQKYQTGVAMNQAEMQRMADIAKEERDFIKQKELIDKEFQNQLALKRARGGDSAAPLTLPSPTSLTGETTGGGSNTPTSNESLAPFMEPFKAPQIPKVAPGYFNTAPTFQFSKPTGLGNSANTLLKSLFGEKMFRKG